MYPLVYLLDTEDTLYFSYQYGSLPEQYKTFPQVSQEMRDLLTEENGAMNKLIIDLRQCSGRHLDSFNSLMSHFKSLQQSLTFNAYVLIGATTYSKGIINVTDAPQYLNATTVGQETGGNSTTYGNDHRIESPHSKSVAYISKSEFNHEPNNGALLPNLEAIQTFKDYQKGIYAALEASLAH